MSTFEYVVASVALAAVLGPARVLAQAPAPTPVPSADACAALVDRYVRESGAAAGKPLRLSVAFVEGASGTMRTGTAVVSSTPTIAMIEPQHLETFALPSVSGTVVWDGAAAPLQIEIGAGGISLSTADRSRYFSFHPSCLTRSLSGVTVTGSEGNIIVWEPTDKK